jgi:hypothetical protein
MADVPDWLGRAGIAGRVTLVFRVRRAFCALGHLDLPDFGWAKFSRPSVADIVSHMNEEAAVDLHRQHRVTLRHPMRGL